MLHAATFEQYLRLCSSHLIIMIYNEMFQNIRTQGGRELPFYEKVLIAAGAGGLGGLVGLYHQLQSVYY